MTGEEWLGERWVDPLAPPVVTESKLSNGELNQLCIELMNWKEINFGESILFGVDEDHIEWDVDQDGVLDFLNDDTLSQLLIDEMAKEWCVEISSRTVSAEGKLLKRWNAYFWEPELKFPQVGGMAVNPNRRKSIVLAALKAKKVIPW